MWVRVRTSSRLELGGGVPAPHPTRADVCRARAVGMQPSSVSSIAGGADTNRFGGNDEMGAAMTAASAVGPATTHPVWRGLGRRVLLVVLLAAGCAALAVPAARAAMPPAQDPFYKYEGKTRLKKIAPGTVLKTRTVPFHLSTIELPITAVQLLYRSTSALGKPTVNVTSVLLPPVKLPPRRSCPTSRSTTASTPKTTPPTRSRAAPSKARTSRKPSRC